MNPVKHLQLQSNQHLRRHKHFRKEIKSFRGDIAITVRKDSEGAIICERFNQAAATTMWRRSSDNKPRSIDFSESVTSPSCGHLRAGRAGSPLRLNNLQIKVPAKRGDLLIAPLGPDLRRVLAAAADAPPHSGHHFPHSSRQSAEHHPHLPQHPRRPIIISDVFHRLKNRTGPRP